ncbi:MAG TPA: anthranilate phosphoribosyltransferase [Dongiaceae bacterium]|nr:anthranilate phosphoribosyltransferase [Dongiaceae bacterium]
MSDLKPLIAAVAGGRSLDENDAAQAFDILMSGDATPAQIGGFLMALRVRGETVAELTGAVRTMRAKMLKIEAPAGAVDTCGTGGDNSGTLNISTGAAIVTAACGVPVAKHGNRAASSRTGTADALSALGVNIEADMTLVKEALWRANICFMLAPRHHSAMRHVGPSRVELGTRTIFNLMGPLSNPAGTRLQLLGVFAKDWIEPMALVLGALGTERAWVVHGSDGLDEITTTGPTHVADLREGKVRLFEVTPEMAGLPRATPAELKGADAATNAAAITELLAGRPGPYRDIVLLNSAAALLVAGKAADLKAGVALATAAVDSGKAKATLAQLIAITNRAPGA